MITQQMFKKWWRKIGSELQAQSGACGVSTGSVEAVARVAFEAGFHTGQKRMADLLAEQRKGPNLLPAACNAILLRADIQSRTLEEKKVGKALPHCGSRSSIPKEYA